MVTRSNQLGLNKVLNILQPSQVLLLLFHVDVIWDEDGQSSVDSSLIQISLQKHLQILIKVAKWRADIQVLSLVDLLCSLGIGVRWISVVIDVVDNNHAILNNTLNRKSTFAGLLDNDVQSRWERWFLFFLALSILFNRIFWGDLEVLFVSLVDVLLNLVRQSTVLIVGLGVESVEVGYGESDSDPEKIKLNFSV